MGKTSIEWTRGDDGSPGETWNPLAGCSEVSPGCLHCYAAVMARRLEAMGQEKYKGTTKKVAGRTVWTGKISLDEDALTIPLRRKKPTRYFVNSMSDLFHADVPDEFIDKVFGVMACCPQHTFQVLTKRAERMSKYMNLSLREGGGWEQMLYDGDFPFPDCDAADIGYQRISDEVELSNVWLGVSVEDQKRKERLDLLRQTPTAIRFVSFEPLLEVLGDIDLTGIHWAIVGGESGHGARPCDIAWIRSIISQCKLAGVACFVKQAGSNPQDASGNRGPGSPLRLKDRKGGDISVFPEDLRVRQYPDTKAV